MHCIPLCWRRRASVRPPGPAPMMAMRGADMIFCLDTELLVQWKSWEKQAEMGTRERMSVCMGNPPVFIYPRNSACWRPCWPISSLSFTYIRNAREAWKSLKLSLTPSSRWSHPTMRRVKRYLISIIILEMRYGKPSSGQDQVRGTSTLTYFYTPRGTQLPIGQRAT